MKKLRELFRLKYDSELTHRQIGRALNISPGTVSYYTQAFTKKDLQWPLSAGLDDAALMEILEPLAKQLAKKFKDPGDWIPISFNQWFVDTEYRKKLAERLYLKDHSLPRQQRLCKAGPGSSFQKYEKPENLDLLRRWKRFSHRPRFLE